MERYYPSEEDDLPEKITLDTNAILILIDSLIQTKRITAEQGNKIKLELSEKSPQEATDIFKKFLTGLGL